MTAVDVASSDSVFLRRLHEYPLVHSTTRVLGSVYGLSKAYLPLMTTVETAIVSRASAHKPAIDAFSCAQLDRFELRVVAPATHALDATVSAMASVEHALAALAFRVVDAADAAVDHLPAAADDSSFNVFAAKEAAEKTAEKACAGTKEAVSKPGLGAETMQVLRKARSVGGKARTRVLAQASRPVHAAWASPAGQSIATHLHDLRTRTTEAATAGVAATVAAERAVLRATTNVLHNHPSVAAALTSAAQLPGCRAVVAAITPWLPALESESDPAAADAAADATVVADSTVTVDNEVGQENEPAVATPMTVDNSDTADVSATTLTPNMQGHHGKHRKHHK
jgi:hypothetical protein